MKFITVLMLGSLYLWVVVLSRNIGITPGTIATDEGDIAGINNQDALNTSPGTIRWNTVKQDFETYDGLEWTSHGPVKLGKYWLNAGE